MNFGKNQADRIGISEIEVNLNLTISRLQNENSILKDKIRQLERTIQDCLNRLVMPIIERDPKTGRAKTDGEKKTKVMRLTKLEQEQLKRRRINLEPSGDLITIHAICSNCDKDIKAIGVRREKLYYCEKLECQLIILDKLKKDWKIHVAPERWIEAQEMWKKLSEKI